MPTVEMAVGPLVAGAQIGDPTDPVAVALKDGLTTVSQQKGYQQALFGTQVENPENLELLITWDSLQHHRDFMATPDYAPLLKTFGAMFSGPVQMHHVDFVPDGASAKVFAAPVTEVATFYYDVAPPAGYLDVARSFGERLDKEGAEGYLGSVIGITHEDVEKDEVKGKAAVLAIGWQSVEAHSQFRETALFKEVIGDLRGESKTREVHHTAFMQFLG